MYRTASAALSPLHFLLAWRRWLENCPMQRHRRMNVSGAPTDGPPSAVLQLLSIKRYNLSREALLTTRMAVDTWSYGDCRCRQILAQGRRTYRLFKGPFHQSFTLPVPQPPLLVSIITKYAHKSEVLAQHFQALGHARCGLVQREFQ